MDQKDEVKSKADIVEVISSYIPLKKTGRNFAALCPFHNEKTPSFMVSPERQVFKCFGCGEAGDVLTFLQKIEGWEFREALEELAKRVGVKLVSFQATGISGEKEKLISINKLALRFYKFLLNEHPVGARARIYLDKRSIPKSLWEKFDLGYAPNDWEKLSGFLTKHSYNLADIAKAGLIIGRDARESSYYDRFRNRLIFPLKDSRGTTLGFSGRLIDEGDKTAKYINSPQTSIFNKSALFFGLDLARGAIREKNEAILVEGEFDVISAHKAGIENVVASKGTALTDQQVAILSRLTERVIIGFDADLAGDAAARRGIELLDLAGTSVKVVKLGKYKDPDEFCQKDPSGFKQAIAGALNVYDYFLESATRRFDPKSVEGQKNIGKEILPVLSKISDDLVRAHYIDKLAKILDLDVNLIASAVEKKVANLYFEIQDKTAKSFSKTTIDAEEYFLALFISREEIETQIVLQLLPSDFKNEKARHFWQWVRGIIKNSKNIKKALKKLPDNLSEFVDHLYLVNISPAFSERELWAKEIVKIARRIKQESLKRRLQEISQRLKAAQEKSDMREVTVLTKKFDETAKYLETI